MLITTICGSCATAIGKLSAPTLYWFGGEVRTGAAGRVTPTFLSALITTARARLKIHPDHGQDLPTRTSALVPVVAVTSTGSNLPPQTHVGCGEPPAKACNQAWLAHLIVCGSGHDGLLDDASRCRTARLRGGVTSSSAASHGRVTSPSAGLSGT